MLKNNVVQKKYKSAHKLCQKQIEIYKEDKRSLAYTYNLTASVYMREKKLEDAKIFYEKAIDTDPDLLVSYGALARIHMIKGNPDQIIAQYNTILEKNPNLPSPHLMLGNLYEGKTDFTKAESHYRKALEINPEFAAAANNLAYHLAERTSQYDEALKYAKIAKEQRPEDPYITDTLGWTYYKKGLYGNAVSEFIDVLKKLPDNPDVHYHLGLAYYKKEQFGLAKKQLLRALELNAKFAGADEASLVLEELKLKGI